MEGPDEISCRVSFLKEEGNRCFKKDDFDQASAFYLATIKLLFFNCIVFDVDEPLFKRLSLTLNLTLAAFELNYLAKNDSDGEQHSCRVIAQSNEGMVKNANECDPDSSGEMERKEESNQVTDSEATSEMEFDNSTVDSNSTLTSMTSFEGRSRANPTKLPDVI
ncbi:hypothetical protein Cgig2_026122 [Carnegiea gigantea]|uniref:Uncharacterized protein n=1 Tax=Carnegiea gigantea TaxID=171969 RepID=A0A9Q1GSW3_9CARY|nr:hypothetical protein Cgig2_026122 [Carnegiea gigantea]